MSGELREGSLIAERPTRVRWGVLALVSTLSMITYLDRVCFGTAAPLMAKELGLAGVQDMKWAFVAFTIAYGLFEIPAGWLGDQWGPRSTLIRIVCWWSLFTALTGVIGMKWGSVTLGGLPALIVLRFLFGAGEAGAYPNITRVIHNWIPIQHWESAQGIIFMSGRLAGGITPLIWAVMVAGMPGTPPLMNWRAAFGVFGLMGIAWCLIFAFCFYNHPSKHPGTNQAERELIGTLGQQESGHTAVPWRELLTHPGLISLCLMYSLVNYGWIFNITYLAGYLKLRYEVADNDLLGAIGKGSPLWVGAIGCVSGGILVSRLSRRLESRWRGRKFVCVPAMIICAICWLCARSATSMPLFCLLISLAALGVDVTLGAAWASCQDIGRQHAAVAAAMMNTVGTMGASLASWATGAIVEHYLNREAVGLGLKVSELPSEAVTSASIAGYQTVFVTYALIYIVAAVCWLGVGPSRHSSERIGSL